jgi:DNA polymerase bacteriophage-type
VQLLFLDIETRGSVPVTVHGLYRHAEDPDLRLLCVSYALGDAPVKTWRCAFYQGDPARGEPIPFDLLAALIDTGVMLVAWNAGYERVVLNAVLLHHYDARFVHLPVERFICAAAWAAAHNLPRSLEDCSKALLPENRRKTDAGKVAKFMWSTEAPLLPEHEEAFEVGQVAYCERDVDAMRWIWECLTEPTAEFLADYHASERINDTGMLFDEELIDAAIRLAPRVDLEVRQELDEITGGQVKPRGPSFLKWLQRELPEEIVSMLTVQKKRRQGLRWFTEERLSTDKGVRARILEELEDWENVQDIRDAMACYDEANKAAVKKYDAAKDRITADGLIKGAYILNGASTGRFSSTGIQMHNLLRATAKDPELLIHQLKVTPYAVLPTVLSRAPYVTEREPKGITVNRGLSLSIRPGIMADEGNCLTWCDLSAIEARVLPWLANDPEAEEILDLFRAGEDVYIHEAAGIYRVSVARLEEGVKAKDKVAEDMRQAGKVAILALGFGGANGALGAMARNYGLTLDDATQTFIVQAWRRKNAWAPRFWKKLMAAAEAAIETPGTPFDAGRVSYIFDKRTLGGCLYCFLPSGRFIAYPEAHFAEIERYKRKYRAVVYRHPVYGWSVLATTIAAENITQAEAASVLRGAIRGCLAEDLQVVGHTHDEILVEEREEDIDQAAKDLQRIMTTVPDWAHGLPLAASAEIGFRYKVRAE